MILFICTGAHRCCSSASTGVHQIFLYCTGELVRCWKMPVQEHRCAPHFTLIHRCAGVVQKNSGASTPVHGGFSLLHRCLHRCIQKFFLCTGVLHRCGARFWCTPHPCFLEPGPFVFKTVILKKRFFLHISFLLSILKILSDLRSLSFFFYPIVISF